jgi:hypothetical protein
MLVICTYKILVGKPKGKRALRRPRHKWEDIRMVLREIGWEGVDWIHDNQPLGSIKGREFLD